MASKEMTVYIDNIEVKTVIRRIKKKEFKDLVIKIAEKADILKQFFDSKDYISKIKNILEENIDFICDDFIKPYVNLTNDQLDNIDLVDLIELIKEILQFNRINIDKIINFFTTSLSEQPILKDNQNFKGIAIPFQS